MRESQHCLLLVFSKFGASTNDIPVQRCKSPIVISFVLGLVKASETREQKSRFIRPRSADRVEGSPVPRKPITGNRVCVRLYCDTTCTWGGSLTSRFSGGRHCYPPWGGGGASLMIHALHALHPLH